MINETKDPAIDLVENLAGSGLPPSFAKLYSQHIRLRTHQTGLKQWREEESSMRLGDAVRLLDAAFVLRDAGNGNWRAGARRAGELLEWLSHPELNVDRLPLRLLAAAAYQIAGYPARSVGLLDEDSIENTESEILRLLLKADFRNLFSQLARYWTDVPASSMQRAADLPWNLPNELPERLQQLIVNETASSAGVLCAAMRWGDEPRLQKAVDKLSAISKVLLHGDDSYSWLLARLCAEVASAYVDSSMRHCLENLFTIMIPLGQIALERYLRYNYIDSKALAWPSQARGIARLVTNESFALCTPTGSGKTTVAELAILQSLFSSSATSDEIVFGANLNAPLALYLVPSRALAAEVESKLSSVLRRLRIDKPVVVTGLYGGTDWGPTDAWLTSEEPTVLICTYEKAEALMRFLGPLFLYRVTLIVLDEVHMIQYDGKVEDLCRGENRGLRLEALGARLFTFLNQGSSRIIALSAMAGEIEDTLAAWVTGQREAVAVSTAYRSTRQLIGRLECLPNRRFAIRYDLLDGSGLRFEAGEATGTPYVPNPFSQYPNPINWEKSGIETRLRPYLLWAAMNLVAPDAKGLRRSVLISIAQSIGGYAEDFLALLEDWKDNIPSFFSVPTDSNEFNLWQKSLQSCADYFGEQSREYRLLRIGIAVHHGKMPGRMARLLFELIHHKIVRLVLATSTLSEGVNLPFEIILIPTLRRANSYLNVREFGNLVGRAGRPGYSTEGQSLVLFEPGPSAGRKHYEHLIDSLGPKTTQPGGDDSDTSPKSPLEALLLFIESQWRKIPGENSHNKFYEWLEKTAPLETDFTVQTPPLIEALDSLDSILISATVELEQINGRESSADELEDWLKRIWQRSYAHFASKQEADLQGIFVQRGKVLRSDIYPNSDQRRRLYRTSLPPRFGNQLLNLYPRLRQHLETGEEYARWESSTRFEYIRTAVSMLGALEKFKLGEKAGRGRVNWEKVLRWWLDPRRADIIPDENKVSDWYNYVAQNFNYRFNWGLGSIIALAMDDIYAGQLQLPSLGDWPQTGLPWIVFWIKELIVWGTLDPVAAYLLAREVVVTRSEAEKLAVRYYEEQPENQTSDELLNALTIRNWVDALVGHVQSSAAEQFDEIETTLLRDFTDMPHRQWRVVPVVIDNEIRWFDPAGFPLATSPKPSAWISGTFDIYDYLLIPDRPVVVCSQYLLER